MARPQKNNLDYFSHDKDMRNDLKIRNVRRKFGHKGYSVYVMMLEHLSDCEYLQYKWDELSIELLVPDFDIDYEELVEIVNHCIKLELFSIEMGYLVAPKMVERHLPFMGERKSFNYNNSPIMKLKQDLSNKSEINQVMNPFNTQSKIKENKINESKEKESKEKESKEEQSKEQNSMIKDIEIEIELEEYQRKIMLNEIEEELNKENYEFINWNRNDSKWEFNSLTKEQRNKLTPEKLVQYNFEQEHFQTLNN